MVNEFANWSDLLIKLVNFFVTILAVYLVDRKGRKFLLKIGTLGIVFGDFITDLKGIGVGIFQFANRMLIPVVYDDAQNLIKFI